MATVISYKVERYLGLEVCAAISCEHKQHARIPVAVVVPETALISGPFVFNPEGTVHEIPVEYSDALEENQFELRFP